MHGGVRLIIIIVTLQSALGFKSIFHKSKKPDLEPPKEEAETEIETTEEEEDKIKCYSLSLVPPNLEGCWSSCGGGCPRTLPGPRGSVYTSVQSGATLPCSDTRNVKRKKRFCLFEPVEDPTLIQEHQDTEKSLERRRASGSLAAIEYEKSAVAQQQLEAAAQISQPWKPRSITYRPQESQGFWTVEMTLIIVGFVVLLAVVAVVFCIFKATAEE